MYRLRKNIRNIKNGYFTIQDISAGMTAKILNPQPGDLVLDACSAPGGKTTQIAALTNNMAYITACEKNKIRAERLKYNLQKQGVGCVSVMLEDARKLSDFFSFDNALFGTKKCPRIANATADVA